MELVDSTLTSFHLLFPGKSNDIIHVLTECRTTARLKALSSARIECDAK